MAICGHYSPPMSHTHPLTYSMCSSRAVAMGLFTALLPPALLPLYGVLYSGCCYWCLLSHSTPSNTPYWHTSGPAVMQGVVYLPERWVRCRHAYKHTHVHMPNMDSPNGGSSRAVSPCWEYPFHSGSISSSYAASLLFSSFNLSLSPCTSISAGVWAQLWIRSLWVNP